MRKHDEGRCSRSVVGGKRMEVENEGRRPERRRKVKSKSGVISWDYDVHFDVWTGLECMEKMVMS